MAAGPGGGASLATVGAFVCGESSLGRRRSFLPSWDASEWSESEPEPESDDMG